MNLLRACMESPDRKKKCNSFLALTPTFCAMSNRSWMYNKFYSTTENAPLQYCWRQTPIPSSQGAVLLAVPFPWYTIPWPASASPTHTSSLLLRPSSFLSAASWIVRLVIRDCSIFWKRLFKTTILSANLSLVFCRREWRIQAVWFRQWNNRNWFEKRNERHGQED